MPLEIQRPDGQAWLSDMPHCPLAVEKLQAIGHALNLTSRELQIIRGLLDGSREETIARELGISRFTVHTHLGRVYRKLNVDCGTGLLLRIFNEYIALDPGAPRPAVAAPAEMHSPRRQGS